MSVASVKSLLVSIVIPVYNGGKFLASAIDSVLAQTETAWELILVDDGSTDGSAAICDDYVNKDSRIRAFHQPNGGVNSARAKGVDNAGGEYLTFLDADDRLAPDALQYWTERFTNADDLLVTYDREAVLSREDYLKALWKGEVGPELWGKVFRMSIYKQIDYAIDRRLAMGEDLLLNSLYALKADRVKTLPRKAYLNNYDNDASVTKTFKHNWEYEKYYFGKVDELFLARCPQSDPYDSIRQLVYKSRLNAMKYVILQDGKPDYKDEWYKETRAFFRGRQKDLGPSERLLFLVRNPSLYRKILGTYMKVALRNKKR